MLKLTKLINLFQIFDVLIFPFNIMIKPIPIIRFFGITSVFVRHTIHGTSTSTSRPCFKVWVELDAIRRVATSCWVIAILVITNQYSLVFRSHQLLVFLKFFSINLLDGDDILQNLIEHITRHVFFNPLARILLLNHMRCLAFVIVLLFAKCFVIVLLTHGFTMLGSKDSTLVQRIHLHLHIFN